MDYGAVMKAGQTYSGGQTPGTTGVPALEGSPVQVRDLEPKGSSNLMVRNSGRTVTGVLVRNVSGGTLAPKAVVKWKDEYRGTQVDGVTTASNSDVAGVVDPFIVGTVPNNDLFILFTKGPCETNMADASYGANDAVKAGAAVGVADAGVGIYTLGHVINAVTVTGAVDTAMLDLCIGK